LTITYTLGLTPDLRIVKTSSTHVAEDPVFDFTPPGVKVVDYAEKALVYYPSWRVFRAIHRAAYMGHPIGALRDHVQTQGGQVDLVTDPEHLPLAATGMGIDSIRLPANKP
jgi:hypothetical protein